MLTFVYYLYPDRTEYYYKTRNDEGTDPFYGSTFYVAHVGGDIYKAEFGVTSTPKQLQEWNGSTYINKPAGSTSNYEIYISSSAYLMPNKSNTMITHKHCQYYQNKAQGTLVRGIINSETVNKSNNYCNGQTNSFIALVPKVYDDTNKSQLKFTLNCNSMPSSVKFNVRYSYTYYLYDTTGNVRETKDVTTSQELSCKDSGKSITIPTEITSATAAQGRLDAVVIDTIGTSMDDDGSGCGFDRCGCTTISGTKYGVAIEDTSYE